MAKRVQGTDEPWGLTRSAILDTLEARNCVALIERASSETLDDRVDSVIDGTGEGAGWKMNRRIEGDMWMQVASE